jgi:tRNA-dihydrouridine synthase B
MLQIASLRIENGLVLAPMAGYTNLGFRLTIKKLGAGLVTTEMVSAMGLTSRAMQTKSPLPYRSSVRNR